MRRSGDVRGSEAICREVVYQEGPARTLIGEGLACVKSRRARGTMVLMWVDRIDGVAPTYASLRVSLQLSDSTLRRWVKDSPSLRASKKRRGSQHLVLTEGTYTRYAELRDAFPAVRRADRRNQRLLWDGLRVEAPRVEQELEDLLGEDPDLRVLYPTLQELDFGGEANAKVYSLPLRVVQQILSW